MKTVEYASYTKEQLEKEFLTSLTNGLTQRQAIASHLTNGQNTLNEQELSVCSILLRQFNTPFGYLLLAAAVVSFLLHDRINALIIVIIVSLNGLLGFYQEYKAGQALKLLKTHLTMKARVIREGKEIVIDSKELVPGDVILLQTGDLIPADIILYKGSLSVNESILTGESVPVQKNEGQAPLTLDTNHTTNLCFLSTMVVEGAAQGVVVATGSKTMFGEISNLTLHTSRQSGFHERLAHLSRFILSIIFISLTCLFIFHLLIKGVHTDIVQLLFFSIALTLGLTPEALPTVTTFALSRGALQLVRHDVVVKRLSAIEDLGAINILCTDKTGTLTENSLSVNALYEEKNGTVLPYMLLASKKNSTLDPFDSAVIKAASAQVLDESSLYTVIKEIPFNPALRRNSIIVSKDNEYILISRGSFESIKNLSLPLSHLELLTQWITQQAEQGNRTLAVAYKKAPTLEALDQEDECTFLGLVSFYDPIKATTRGALKKAHKLGITIKMLTGDSAEVAIAVARQIGLSDTAITGPEFQALSLEEKQKAVEAHAIFARIVPQQKYEIVELLKAHNSVGFIGEGINDAPALKAAHVAIVVKGASDIAQDAADILLLRPSLFSVIEGIEIGRQVFSNTLKYILATISSSFGNCYSVAIASLFTNFLPLLPLQILLINLLSDLPMVTIAVDTVDTEELKKPQQYDLRSLALMAALLGIVSSLFDALIFALYYSKGASVLQTNLFIESILTELVLIFSIRTKRVFYKAKRPALPLIGASIMVASITLLLPSTHVGQTFFQFQPLDWRALDILGAVVCMYFITTELVKLLYYRYKRLNHVK
ncbi:HAD-IC family P-type ATPase [Candidatus Dependentiae bacterium]|nr:HAD-IC family P-type ATPase [Candidatus Dependentiae bacterium]